MKNYKRVFYKISAKSVLSGLLKPSLILLFCTGLFGCIPVFHYPYNSVQPDPKIKDVIYSYALIDNGERILLIGSKKDYVLSNPAMVSLLKDYNSDKYSMSSRIDFQINRPIGHFIDLNKLSNNTACFFIHTHNKDEKEIIKRELSEKSITLSPGIEHSWHAQIDNVSIEVISRNINKPRTIIQTTDFVRKIEFGIFDNDTSWCSPIFTR